MKRGQWRALKEKRSLFYLIIVRTNIGTSAEHLRRDITRRLRAKKKVATANTAGYTIEQATAIKHEGARRLRTFEND